MLTRRTTIAFGLLAAVGCSSAPDDSSSIDPGPVTPPTETPAEAGPGVVGAPSNDEITEDFGVFVAASGGADADGTRAKPFGAIAPAIEKARALTKRVYVCSGTFKEAVTIAQGVSLIGALDCSTPVWKLGTVATRLESPTSPALRAENIDQATLVSGFDVVAPDGSATTPTSVALFARSAPKLAVTQSSLNAGKGFDGAAGEEGTPLTLVAGTGATRGEAEVNYGTDLRAGGQGGTGSCVGAPGLVPGAGGRGGNGGNYLVERCTGSGPFSTCIGGPNALTWRNRHLINLAGSQVPIDGAAPENGETGKGPAAIGGADGPSAMVPGRFTLEGSFTPSNGGAGTSGTVGRGGAGGKGATTVSFTASFLSQAAVSAGGPGGGVGGCPGLAGKPGQGGGASVGAVVVNSAGLTFDTVQITTAKGGSGGKGSFGSDPTRGEPAAPGWPYAGAASEGEAGGRAGVSGSGAGGSSVGIAYTGGEPVRTKTTIKVGEGGAAVPEEKKTDGVGNAKTLPASVAGEAKELLTF